MSLGSKAAGTRSGKPLQPVSASAYHPRFSALSAPAGLRDQSRQLMVSLHCRTADAIASAPARIAGRIGDQLKPERILWHRRLLGYRRPLPTVIFSSEWLEQQQAGLGSVSLSDYLKGTSLHRIDPHPLFDAGQYLDAYPDVAECGMSPLVHYVLHGWREGRDPHPLFSNDWYLAQNLDVAAAGSISPLDHYLSVGWREGRWPNPLFGPQTYLDRYPDVDAAEIEPLTHFIANGQHEGRELSIIGWGKDFPDIAAQGGAITLMTRLLRDPPAHPAANDLSTVIPSEPALDGSNWPPLPVDDFWPAQTMRELVNEFHGETVLARIGYLLSLMNRWQDSQEKFVSSEDCRDLLERLRIRAKKTALSGETTPSASIIIPIYNNILDTLLCLNSILELDERHSFEIIIADDGSSDASPEILTTINGVVRYIRQPQNLGFLGNCNAAAVKANGRNIVLLNNDTLVLPGWLDGLINPIEQFANVGFVGSKLINWDGTLQEAGGIFWRDGSAWNFGRNQDSRSPEFNYLKDVDYCSGASIAIPTEVWRALGGFDPIFSPAYCEDSDIAFRLRDAGYRTLYSPASEVVHHEGRSHGRDLSSGVKAYQVKNQQQFFERWQAVLERDNYPNAENVMRARDRSFNRKHVLVVDHYVPQWDKDAGSRTMFDFLQVLIEAGHAVTFWPDNLWRDPDYTSHLQALGIEVIFGPRFLKGFDQFLADRHGLYDMVLLSRPHIAANYVDAVKRHTNARLVYYGHDLHFSRMMAERELAGNLAEDAEVLAMKAQEIGICNSSDVVLYPSEDEAKCIGELIKPGVIARAIPAYRYLPAELEQARTHVLALDMVGSEFRLLFVGGFGHQPNIDAIIWFCDKVMPILRKRTPTVRLTIVGSRPSQDILALSRKDVEVLGFVPDDQLLELYREVNAVIAPLRYGAGVKGKVIEAMARGVPVVTTPIGAQGIPNANDLMFLGEAPDELADQVLRAAEPAAAQQRSMAALHFIERYYSTNAMMEVLQSGLNPDQTFA